MMELLELSDVQQMFNDSGFQRNLSELTLDDVDEPLPRSAKITVVVVYLIVCVVGLVGNCLVMFVIIRYTKMKTATNIYIFNLALADALVLATLPFQGTDVILGFWPFGLALCKAVVAIDYYNMFTSVFTLTIMSVDRYIAVCHPVRSLTVRTPLRAKLINVAVWVLASAVGLPVMIMGQVEEDVYGAECMLNLPKPKEHWGPVFVICVFLFSFLIPVVIISVCYGLMVRRLRSVRLLSGSREKDRNLRRITYMVLSVVAAFVLCWMPVQVLALIQALGHVDLGASQSSVAALHFCIALGYANSCLNPVLYAFLDENFKRCFREFCIPANSSLFLEDQNKRSLRQEREFAEEEEKEVVIDEGAIPVCVD
ncbi:LOW QUALITY PROTEIN: delta-type opioid receptor [Ctenopharyngodon idella]|uniref:LOW QUALITY PROTEIN: delta-type opioid receptor n=1 Tax=Ctenopharyngodon idella TaxID=7959 RepID=UPI00222F1296|nr:LOW QUALITY PROTEIN: delta-type opioid receptor [Ctenopharyngodon idella]